MCVLIGVFRRRAGADIVCIVRLSGKPLFPGRDCLFNYSRLPVFKAEMTYIDHHQLTLILDVLGTPSLDDFYAISSHRSRDYLRALPFKKRRPLQSLYPNANPLAIDLLERCLTFNPKKRITVEEALAHPYLEPYHDADDEPTAAVLRELCCNLGPAFPLIQPHLIQLRHSSRSTRSSSHGNSSSVSPSFCMNKSCHPLPDIFLTELIYDEITAPPLHPAAAR